MCQLRERQSQRLVASDLLLGLTLVLASCQRSEPSSAGLSFSARALLQTTLPAATDRSSQQVTLVGK